MLLAKLDLLVIHRDVFQPGGSRTFESRLAGDKVSPGGVVLLEFVVDGIDEPIHQRGQCRGGSVNRGDIVRSKAHEACEVLEPIAKLGFQPLFVNVLHG